jgi:hypothetical protein
MGIDKPGLCIVNNNLCARFVDEPIKFRTDIAAYQHSIVEFFYWTPDSPYIVVNQIHEILRYLQQNLDEFRRVENCLRTSEKWNEREHSLDRVTNAACYPLWRPVFQTNKTLGQFQDQQFHSLLVPFVQTEKFAKVFHHRYYDDSKVIRQDLLSINTDQYYGTKNQLNLYPIMSLQKFYQGAIQK